ncbi:MAG TPA: hypothetical protein GX721_04685 [Firmicutes bacterium]|jgi:hypothetical protein|nr:hypothetical protein [Bacillota bacterium]
MTWEKLIEHAVEEGAYIPIFHPKALNELEAMLKSDRGKGNAVVAAIIKLCRNPLPRDMGGVGNRLGKRKGSGNLKPLLCAKLKGLGTRIVYALTKQEPGEDAHEPGKTVTILAIGTREDMKAYIEASRRKSDVSPEWPREWRD